MKVKNIIYEDFTNYKKPSMFIGMGTCNWKCCIENGIDKSVCQNSELATTENIEIAEARLCYLYSNHTISEALVIGGLEPFDDFQSLKNLIRTFREYIYDDIVIYTGYYPYEIPSLLYELDVYENIIIKFGRYNPNLPNTIKDPVLGVQLASSNQYGVRLNHGHTKTIKALQNNNGYCPCAIQQNEDTKCCCFSFRKQLQGTCHCGIFSK